MDFFSKCEISKLEAFNLLEKEILAQVFSLNVTKFYPAGIYLFKVNNRNTRTRCEICSKLTIKIPERRYWQLASFWYLYP